MSERGPEGREGQVGREGAAGREGLPGEAGATGETGEQGPRGRKGEPLPRNVRLAFIIIVVISAVSLTLIAGFAISNRRLANQGKQAHEALCVVKANFEVRKQRTEDFLKNNPGSLILGIPRREFERSLKDTQETLNALDTLACRPPAEPTTTESIP